MGNNNSISTSPKSLRISNLTAVTTSNSCSIENKEDVTLIWLDKTIDASRTALREIINYVLLYTELEPCIAHIRSINTERIFLIVSGSYAETCLNQIHDLPQVDSIFIFCMNLNKYKNQYLNSSQYSKIINIFDNEKQLIESVRQELNDLQKQLSTFSLYKNQKSTRDLLKESASFLWFQLFKDILIQMPQSEQAKKDMINQCKQFYRGNQEELNLIEEFEQTYTKNDSIHWYTKQCFIYRLCNKALRTEDIELLYIFRYFIQDLCKCLAIEYETFKIQQKTQPIIKVYRGLKLTKDEIEKYQTNIGSLISTNGFLSTSKNYNLALKFALKTSKRTVNVLPTLFIIEANINIDYAIFADISSLSVYPEEQEILFDIGCAFKINEVYFDNDKNIWIIKMKLSNEGRQIIETYIEANRREMEKGNIFLIFGLLLTEMGQYDHAQIYFENLLSSNTVDDKSSIYTNIGRVKYLKGLYDEALEDFKKVYNFYQQQTNINDIDLARIINNIGLIYMEQKNYELAFNYLFNVLKIYEKNSTIDKLLIANTNNAIGIIYSSKFEYNQSLEYLFIAMKYYEKYLPTIDHSLMAMNYNSIGLVYYYMKNYEKSLDYCLKSYNIRKKILPINHLNLGDSYNNLALIYQKLYDYKKSLDLFQQSLKIYENNLNKKMNIPICLNNIGLLMIDQKDYDQAINYYFKALDYYFNNNQKKYQDDICYTLDNIGIAYEMKQDDEQALKYYKKSLEYQENTQKKFIEISIKIGNIYYKNNDYTLALEYYEKVLNKIELISQELLSNLYLALGLIYHQKKQYQKALDFYKNTLKIHKQLSINENLDLAWVYNNLGCLYTDLDDINHALKYQEKAYNIRKNLLDSLHPDLATSLTNLGRIHQTIAHQITPNFHELNQAFENYKSALFIRQKSLPINHPDLALSYYNLALIYFDQQEYDKSFAELQNAFNIQKQIFPLNHPHLQQTIKLEKQIQIMLDYQKK